MDAAELLATANGVDLTRPLAAAQAGGIVAQTDELMRAARAAIQDRVEEARTERARQRMDAQRLGQLEEFYTQLHREVRELEAERTELAARLRSAEVAPLPVVGFARRVARIVIAAVVGGIFAGPLAGPVVTHVLTDPILGKAFEGFMGGFAGAMVSEVGSHVRRRRRTSGGPRSASSTTTTPAPAVGSGTSVARRRLHDVALGPGARPRDRREGGLTVVAAAVE